MGDGVEQDRRHFLLFLDGGNDRGASLFQFAQITQSFFQKAQLDIVQPASGFFPITCDKRHGGAFVKQGDRGTYLCGRSGEFEGEALFYGWQHENEENYQEENQGWMIPNSSECASLDFDGKGK